MFRMKVLNIYKPNVYKVLKFMFRIKVKTNTKTSFSKEQFC